MPGFVRVYDKKAKAISSWPAEASLDGLELIEGVDGSDIYGSALPPEFDVDRKPTPKQEAAKQAADADPKPEEGKK